MNIDSKVIPGPENFILIKGAKVHNLKNISLAIPRNRFVVITGLSGSGKSSLAFDTLYAEGQRRYVESLSAYARQFLGRMSKPEVEYIKGISPAIAIEQKVNTRNPRSTVGTSTEIYEYIKLLYARIGKTYSPVSGSLVRRDSVTDVCDFLISLPEETKATILCQLLLKHHRSLQSQLTILIQQGFSRVMKNGEVLRIDELLKLPTDETAQYHLVIDRVAIRQLDEDLLSRLSDSVQTAFYEGDGECICEIESETIKTRLEIYKEQTFPVSQFIEKEGLPVHKVNGEQTVAEVFADVLKAVESKQ